MMLGSTFLVVKGIEYSHKWHEHHVPGAHSQYDGPLANQVQLFFSFYFTMTGIHAFHMILGIAVMSWLTGKALKGGFSPGYYAPVEMAGPYWHFIDTIWIFLFPLLYLFGAGAGH